MAIKLKIIISSKYYIEWFVIYRYIWSKIACEIYPYTFQKQINHSEFLTMVAEQEIIIVYLVNLYISDLKNNIRVNLLINIFFYTS